MIKTSLSLILLLFASISTAKTLKTGAALMLDAPPWLTEEHVNQVVQEIESKLAWKTKRVTVHWHSAEKAFKKRHNLGPMIIAVTINTEKGSAIHLGPKINKQNFDSTFGHELVHLVLHQKYKGAIPAWLEEGMAHHLANSGKVDYAWLSRQSLPHDIKAIGVSTGPSAIPYRYMASQALTEMLDEKCNLKTLLQLHVLRRIEHYLSGNCEIADVSRAYKEWIKRKSLEQKPATAREKASPIRGAAERSMPQKPRVPVRRASLKIDR